MKCSTCGSETSKVTGKYIDGKMVEWCTYCPSPNVVPSLMYDDTGIGRIGVGHKKDIKSRRYDPKTGETYKHVNRTYFIPGVKR